MKKLNKYLLGLALLSNTLWAENHALIIGCCEKYPYINATPLYGTQNDAKHIFDILVNERKIVKQSNTDYLLGENATFNNIKQSLKSLENPQTSNLKRGDTLYMFYSGHGTSLSDKEFFNNKIKNHEKVVEWMKNSAGFIPYDYNPKDVLNTLLISKRDFVPTFTKLDQRGVKIVWIADSCYVGNGDRGSVDGNPAKAFKLDASVRERIMKITQRKYKKTPKYNNLLFYGASISTLPTQEKFYKNESRGEFSIEVERCLNKKYPNSNITHEAFKKCLKSHYSSYNYQPSFSPNGRQQAKQVLMPTTKQRNTQVKQSYKEQLFSLESSQPLLEINIKPKWNSSDKPIKTFCKGEALKATLENHDAKYVIAFSKDIHNKVIMLQPMKGERFYGNTLFEMNVTKPFGVDKLKVFTTNNYKIYRKIFAYSGRKKGVLSTGDIEEIYRVLVENKDFKTINIDVETTSKDVKDCNNGEER